MPANAGIDRASFSEIRDIRYARRMRLKQLSGQVVMNDNGRQLEQAEIDDEQFEI